jgi:hypothetical protein
VCEAIDVSAPDRSLANRYRWSSLPRIAGAAATPDFRRLSFCDWIRGGERRMSKPATIGCSFAKQSRNKKPA